MNERFLHKKSLGQHFLNSEYVPRKLCDAVRVQSGDTVVEIGPGTGVLTKEILRRGAVVIALEADTRAIEVLKVVFAEEIANHQLILHHTDVRSLDFKSIGVAPYSYKVVANIPYYLSGLLFRSFLDSDCQPSDLVFLVQKELAERIARDPKSSLLSLSVRAFGEVHYVGTIKKGHFTPPPQVDSAIVAVTGISNEYFIHLDKETFFTAIKAGFASRRKQLAPNLKALYPVTKTKQTLETMGLSPVIRAEDLDLYQWHALLIHLNSTIT